MEWLENGDSVVWSVLCVCLCYDCIYNIQVDQRIQDEDLRTRKFLHPVSCSRVVRECQSRLVEQYIPYLQTECRQMVKEEKREGV